MQVCLRSCFSISRPTSFSKTVLAATALVTVSLLSYTGFASAQSVESTFFDIADGQTVMIGNLMEDGIRVGAGSTLTINTDIQRNANGISLITFRGDNGTVVNNGDLDKQGSFIATDFTAVSGIDVRRQRAADGSLISNRGITIENNAGATIQAQQISVQAFDGGEVAGITNAGTLSGGFFGIVATGGGVARNRGEMGGEISGLIMNSGTISGGRFGIVAEEDGVISGGTIRNEANGTISATTFDGIATQDGGQISSNIENFGMIDGGDDGINAFGSGFLTPASSISGTITNRADAVISGGFKGIQGNRGSDGVAVDIGGRISGIIENFGTITGEDDGISASDFASQMELTDGDVQGDDTGAEISGAIMNRAGATISGGENGIVAEFGGTISGAISNSGLITGITGIFQDAMQDHTSSRFSQITGEIINNGTITGTDGMAIDLQGNVDNRVTLGTGSVLNGNVEFGGGSDTLTLSGSGSEDGDFAGLEFLVANVAAGREWALSGNVNLESGGSVTVNTGTLRLNGFLSAGATGVSVASGGRLGGTGRISGDVQVAGTLAPGNSPGTLNVDGNVTFSGGSTLEVEVDGAQHDLLDVSGVVTIDPGANLDVSLARPLNMNITFLEAGMINGSFENVTVTGPSAAAVFVTETPRALQLTSSQVTIVSADLSGINAAIRGGLEESFTFQRAVATKAYESLLEPGNGLWAKTIGGYGDRVANEGFAAFDQEIYGFISGVNLDVGNGFSLGFGAGYTRGDVDVSNGGDGDETDSFHSALYSGYKNDDFFANLGLQVGFQDHEVERQVLTGGGRVSTTGDTKATILGGFAQFGTNVALGQGWSVTPRANISYQHYDQESYSDDQGLSVEDFKAESLRLSPALALQGDVILSGLQIKPRISAGLEHEIVLDDRNLDISLNGSPSREKLDDDSNIAGTFGAGFDVIFAPGMTGFVNFDGALGKNEKRYGGIAGMNVDF